MPPLEEIKTETTQLAFDKEAVREALENKQVSNDGATNKAKKSKQEEIQELEQIIEESMEEIQAQEENIQDISEETIKEYEEMEQMKPEQATNNQILKEALLNRSKSQDIETCIVYFKAKENEHFVEYMKELHYIKKHMDKFALISLGLVFACGYIFGTQHEHLSPYIGKMFDIINIFKGNGGQ